MNRRQPQDIKLLKGTDRPDRIMTATVPKITTETGPKRPAHVTGLAKRIWEKRIEVYRMRGQSIEGCEDALARYCNLEARLIEDYDRKKLIAPAAFINAWRILAAEFFDTPASQIGKVSSRKAEENPYSKHGKR